ncbi:MAG TPA: hypothetical protein VEG28_04280, partial [Dehalococcoidia bacterium]|nr:hypothetical protein [Dehalococcoidia bacterium]
DGTWGATPNGFPYQLASISNITRKTVVIGLTSGKFAAFYGSDGGKLYVQSYTGSSWNTAQSTLSNLSSGQVQSETSQGDDVNVVFNRWATYDIVYVKYTYATNSFSAETVVQASTTSTSAPVLSINTANNDLYCFWEGSPTANHIYYKKYSGGSWDANPTDWQSETSISSWYSRLSCYSQSYSGYIGVVWTQGSTGMNVRHNYLMLPH